MWICNLPILPLAFSRELGRAGRALFIRLSLLVCQIVNPPLRFLPVKRQMFKSLEPSVTFPHDDLMSPRSRGKNLKGTLQTKWRHFSFCSHMGTMTQQNAVWLLQHTSAPTVWTSNEVFVRGGDNGALAGSPHVITCPDEKKKMSTKT